MQQWKKSSRELMGEKRPDAWDQYGKLEAIHAEQQATTAAVEKTKAAVKRQTAAMVGGMAAITNKVDNQRRESNERLDSLIMENRVQTQQLETQARITEETNALVKQFGQASQNIQYANWRDGTENGRFFHYEYRPRAFAYLQGYTAMMDFWVRLVHARLAREIECFEEWKEPHWKTSGLTDGIFLPEPNLAEVPPEPEVPPIEIPDLGDHIMKFILGAGAFSFGAFCFSAIVAADAYSPAAIIMTFFMFVFFPFVLPIVFGIRETRMRHWFINNYREELEAHEQTKRFNEEVIANWEQQNLSIYRHVLGELEKATQVDLESDFSQLWATPEEQMRFKAVLALINQAPSNPPARDSLARLGEFDINQAADEEYTAALSEERARQMNRVKQAA